MSDQSEELEATQDSRPIGATGTSADSAPQDPIAAALEGAGHGQRALETPPPTRFPGLRRLVAHLAGLSQDSQVEVNTGVISALREVGEQLAGLSDSLEERVDLIQGSLGGTDQRVSAIEAHLSGLSEDLGNSLGGLEQSANTMATELAAKESASRQKSVADLNARMEAIEAHLSRLSEDLGNSLSGLEQSANTMATELAAKESANREKTVADLNARMEAIQNHLAAMTQDLMADFAEMRSVIHAQGRNVDEVGGELVATTQDIEELTDTRDELRANWKEADERIVTLEKRFEPLTSLDHFDFARRYRGDEKVIQQRMRKYAQVYGPVKRILDFGCGRGEFLLECSRLDIGAYGIDTDADMVSHCQLKKLEVLEGDGIAHLRSLPNRSLDGIFSAQVVEHLTPAQIVEFVNLAGEKLKRGGVIIIETVNPATFSAMRWFYLDPTHSQPVPHEMIRYFLEEANFETREVMFVSPVPDDEKIALAKSKTSSEDPAVKELVRLFNENGRRLNDVLFGPQDYAIIAER